MFFGKKHKKTEISCPSCKSKITKDFNFCPYCSAPLSDPEEDMKDFGMLGRNDAMPANAGMAMQGGLGITDKLLGSMVNSIMKSLSKQMNEVNKANQNQNPNTRVQRLPNGISISIGPVSKQAQTPKTRNIKEKELSEEQIERMSKLSRTAAKTSMKRIGDKVIYEMQTPGIKSPDDIFISKLETGYEIKAIAEKKVYVNSIQIELPMHSFSIREDKLTIEFDAA